MFVQLAALPAAVHSKITSCQPEPGVGVNIQHALHELAKAIIAIGRQPHYLVFLAEFLETDELAACRVKKSKTVRQVHTFSDLDAVSFAPRRHRADKIAASVKRKSGGQ